MFYSTTHVGQTLQWIHNKIPSHPQFVVYEIDTLRPASPKGLADRADLLALHFWRPHSSHLTVRGDRYSVGGC